MLSYFISYMLIHQWWPSNHMFGGLYIYTYIHVYIKPQSDWIYADVFYLKPVRRIIELVVWLYWLLYEFLENIDWLKGNTHIYI